MQRQLHAQPLPAVSLCDGRALLRMRSRQHVTAASTLPLTSACRRLVWDSASGAASAGAARHAQQHARVVTSKWEPRAPCVRRSHRQKAAPAASAGAAASFDGGPFQEPSSEASCDLSRHHYCSSVRYSCPSEEAQCRCRLMLVLDCTRGVQAIGSPHEEVGLAGPGRNSSRGCGVQLQRLRPSNQGASTCWHIGRP